MGKVAVEHIFNGITTGTTTYNPNLTMIGSLLRQYSGASSSDFYVSAKPSAMINIPEYGNAASIMPFVYQYSENIYWVFGLLLQDKSKDAKWWIERLNKLGIGSRPFFYPMHVQPALKNGAAENSTDYPFSENMAKYGFYLPSGVTLSKESIEKISHLLLSVIV